MLAPRPRGLLNLESSDIDEDLVLDITGAYTSLNTMEIVYYMRKDEEDPGTLDKLLSNYIKSSNEAIKNLWDEEDQASRHAFTKEFREKVTEILESTRSD